MPENHILRATDKAIDFSFIYEEVEGLYSEKERPDIDPVSLFKIVFIQYLLGIRSMRRTIRKIEVNATYRWFIGYSLTEPVPHFSTFGKNYVRRFAATDICALPTVKKITPAEHGGCFACSAQTACDRHGFVLVFEVGWEQEIYTTGKCSTNCTRKWN